MKRTIAVAGTTLAVLTAAPLAMAQRPATDFARQGEFIISADRLMPLFAFDDVSADDFGGVGNAAIKSSTTTNQNTSLSLLYGSVANPTAERIYTVPRLGFDYVIVPNVTIGGSIIAVFSLGGSTKQETVSTDGTTRTTSNSNDTYTGFGLAPRAGYILPVADMWALWLRGGFSWALVSDHSPSNNTNTSTTTTVNQLALDLEPQIVFTGIPHVGFTAGIDADIPLTGGISESANAAGTSNSVSGHASIFYLALELGMLAHF